MLSSLRDSSYNTLSCYHPASYCQVDIKIASLSLRPSLRQVFLLYVWSLQAQLVVSPKVLLSLLWLFSFITISCYFIFLDVQLILILTLLIFVTTSKGRCIFSTVAFVWAVQKILIPHPHQQRTPYIKGDFAKDEKPFDTALPRAHSHILSWWNNELALAVMQKKSWTSSFSHKGATPSPPSSRVQTARPAQPQSENADPFCLPLLFCNKSSSRTSNCSQISNQNQVPVPTPPTAVPAYEPM